MEEEAQKSGEESVEDVEGGEVGDGFGVEGETQGFQGKGQDWVWMVRSRYGYLVLVRFDWERDGAARRKGGVYQIKFPRIGVPEKRRCLLIKGTGDGFGLEVGACLAVKPVIDGYRGRLIEGHQFGELWENCCHERIVQRGL